ncbi:hypothetical protein Tco_0657039 [Tanacetum coccineum]|uniref:Tf2-1-like SH3-like domain-containing protein n=1 Tax=Tanacetum coccineum TaxID=301880 RepID=A0ABQ4XB51_9ASTR
MQAARDQQKSYTYLKRKPMEFQVGDKVMLKVLPWKGVVCFGKRGKLNPRYVGPFKVLGKIGEFHSRARTSQKTSFVENPLRSIPCKLNPVEAKPGIPLTMFRWNSKRGPEFTWEREDQFRKNYPHLFTKTGHRCQVAASYLQALVNHLQVLKQERKIRFLKGKLGYSSVQLGLKSKQGFSTINHCQTSSLKVAFDHLRDALSVIFGLSVTQVMSDSEDSTVTYTAVSSPFEDGSDIGSPGVDGPPIMPEDPYAYIVTAYQAPPSPDYVHGPKEPQLPPPLDIVPQPMYPEYMLLEDEILPAEEQPLPAAASPTADSLGYVPKSDLEEEPEEDDEDPEEDPADYPADRDDDDEDEEEDEEEHSGG